MTSAQPVREGHQLAVSAMAAPEFREIVALFDADPRIGGTYFRLVEAGFQPVDLDQLSDKPLIGVGGLFPPTASVEQLTTELDSRVEVLLAKRSTASRSEEKQVEAKITRWALAAGLGFPGRFPETLRFIASQWRIDIGGRAKVVDVVAVDRDTGNLVVIELKTKPDKKAKLLASEYAKHIQQHADAYGPFFSAMAAAMAELYGCTDMPATVNAGTVVAMAAWPADSGYAVVTCQ